MEEKPKKRRETSKHPRVQQAFRRLLIYKAEQEKAAKKDSSAPAKTPIKP